MIKDKMTNEEAIRRIEEFALHHAIGDLPHSILTVTAFQMAIKALEQESVLNKVRNEIMDCLKALDNIEKFNIYLPNEMTGRRLTYQQCLGFIDKYKVESEDKK